MTAVFITEDETDAEVLGALLERIAGRSFHRVPYAARQGFGAVLTTAARLVPHAARAGTAFILVVVDCDGTVDHYSEKQLPHSGCRLCRLHVELPSAHEVARLSANRSKLVPVLTVRTIETWLGVAGGLSIPGSVHDFGKKPEERRRLKEIVYGDPSPGSALMLRRGVELVAAADLGVMEATLNSFAEFAKLVRA